MCESMELTTTAAESLYVDPKLKYEDDESNESEYDEDQAEVEKIVDVMFKKGDLHYKVRWMNFTSKDDTWEPEVNFLGDESKAILRRFKIKNHRKIANILKKEDKKKKKRKNHWIPENNEISIKIKQIFLMFLKDSSRNSYSHNLKPRELSQEDEFYGQKAAATKGEVKGLFDPSHKYSATELFLSTTDPSLKITRSQTRCLLSEGSLNSMRGSVNCENTGGVPGTDSLKHSSDSLAQLIPKNTTDAKRKSGLHEADAILVPPSSILTNFPRSKLELITPQEENYLSSSRFNSNEDMSSNSFNRSQQASHDVKKQEQIKAEVNEDMNINDNKEIVNSQTESAIVHSSEESNSICTKKVVFETGENNFPEGVKLGTTTAVLSVKSSSRRRLAHLLPCPVSLNEKVTKATMSQMLAELELKYYGEERHVSQQKFNEDVLSGDFMRFRRALYQNIAYALRLLTWTNSRGASLLHILCRDVKCTDTHSADDAADMLCKFAHGVVAASDFDGRIPLHEAVQRGQVCRVNILLKYHSPVSIADNAGLTPLDMAYRKNHAKMVKVLLMAGANFSALEANEKRKRNEERRSRAFDVLKSHSSNVRYLLTRTRRKVYRYILDKRTVSPCFTAPFSDGPNFMFQFSFSSEITLLKNQGFVLFLYVCSKTKGQILRDQWVARCWGGLPQSSLPMLNGLPVKPIRFRKGMMNSHMIFLVLPVLGKNILEIFLNVDEILKPCILAAQIVLVERAPREHRRLPLVNTYPVLEKTPNIGPMF